MSSAGIIYSEGFGRVRRVVIPDDDSELAQIALSPGEAMLVVAEAQYQSFAGLSDIQAFVTAQTGKTPSGDRYVVVDGGDNVLAAVIADPAAGDGAPPDQTLQAHPTAQPGDLLKSGNLSPLNQPPPPNDPRWNDPI